jgi:hypothetical protein
MDYLFVIFPKFLIIVDPMIPLLEKKKKKKKKEKTKKEMIISLFSHQL